MRPMVDTVERGRSYVFNFGLAEGRLAVVTFERGFEQFHLGAALLADWGCLAFLFTEERAGALGYGEQSGGFAS